MNEPCRFLLLLSFPLALSACSSTDEADASAGDPSGSTGAPSSGGSGPSTGGSSTHGAGGSGASGGGGGNAGTSSTSSSGAGGNPSTTTPIFRMDCEDEPLECAWGSGPADSPYYTATPIEDGGPNGEDVVEIDHTPQPQGTGQVQYYNGWTRGIDAPAQGATLYVRFWIKPLSPIDWSGTGDVWTDKLVILGDGGPASSRVICALRDDFPLGSGDDMLVSCARNIDGAPSKADGASLVTGQWNWVQIEIRSSSSASAEDGHIAMWFDSGDQASPTSQSSGGFALETGAWSHIAFGRFANTAVAANGHVRYQVGGFELDDAFDPGWAP